MRRSGLPDKIISPFLCCALFTTNSLFAHSVETNFWKERQISNQFSRPNVSIERFENWKLIENFKLKIPNLDLNRFGTVRKIIKPKSPRSNSQTIIHIQDVHLNPEAQKNIGLVIQKLIGSGKLKMVALEGAFAPIDLKVFNEFPHHEVIQTAADSLLAENKISGAIHAALTATSLPPIIGVDDSQHYHANVQAYKNAAAHQAEIKQFLAARGAQLEQEKSTTFNGALKAFDSKVEAYRTKKISMGEYTGTLKSEEKGQIGSFLKALKLESSLNFTQAGAERTLLLTELSRKLNETQLQELLQVSSAFTLGTVNHSVFYNRLKEIGETHNLPLSRFPAMTAYIRYVSLSQSIDSEKLFQEIKEREEATYASLAKTDEERKLVAASKQLYLTEKLVDFSLTREEWGEYKQSRHSGVSLAGIQSYDGMDPGQKRAGMTTLGSFEDFYREAEIRDARMAENFLVQSTKYSVPSTNLSVLVTGGFHAAGIDKQLADAGFTVINFVPKITHLRQGFGGQARDSYLSVFAQEKTPLEKLFEGEKLFLAPEAWTPPLERTAAARVVALSTWIGRAKTATNWFKRLITGGSSGFLWAGRLFANVFIFIRTQSQLVLVRVQFTRGKFREKTLFAVPLERDVWPDALVLQLEALVGTGGVVDPKTLRLILSHLKSGRLVSILSQTPFEEELDDGRWSGMKPQFLDPFILSLQTILTDGEDAAWLSNLRIYTDWGAKEFEILKNEERPPSQPLFSAYGIRPQILFPNPGEFFIQVDAILKDKLGLTPSLPVPFECSHMTLHFDAGLPDEKLNALKEEIKNIPGAANVAVTRLDPSTVVISASNFSRAMEWFGQFALKKRGGEPLRKVVAVGDSFEGLRGLGVVGQHRGEGIHLYREKGSAKTDEEGVTNFQSDTRPYNEISHGVLQAVLRARQNPNQPWQQDANSPLNSETLSALQATFAQTPPDVLWTDLNRVLAKGLGPVPEENLKDLLQILEKKESRLAVFTTAPIIRGPLPTVFDQFLAPLLDQAKKTGMEAPLARLRVYAEGGAVQLRFDRNNNTFVVISKIRLPHQNGIYRETERWLADQNVRLLHVVNTPYQVGLHLDSSNGEALAPRYVDALRQILRSRFSESLRVELHGPNHIVINMLDKATAGRNFINELRSQNVDDEVLSRPLVLTAYSGSLVRHMAHVVEHGGLEISSRELNEGSIPSSEALERYHHTALKLPEGAQEILSNWLPTKDTAPLPSPNPPPPQKESPAYTPPGVPKINQLHGDKPLAGSEGTFHAAWDFNWLTENPPERLYMVSGGGGGDVKSVILFCRALKLMYEKLRKDRQAAGKDFKLPEIVVVDSTVKRSAENPYGGPPDIKKLGFRNDRDQWCALSPAIQGDQTARHFFEVPENMYTRYPLPDENGEGLTQFQFETEWSIGRAAKTIKDWGVKFVLMDGSPAPQQLAEDLHNLNGRDPLKYGVLAFDVGGDVIARLLYGQKENLEHEEEGVRSATTDTFTVALLHKLEEQGVEKIGLGVAGLGRDGELGSTLYHHLERLLEIGGVEGVMDLVGFAQNKELNKSLGDIAAIVSEVRRLPIATESSNSFIDGLLDQIKNSRSYFEQLSKLPVDKMWKLLLSPDRKNLPKRPLRMATRALDAPRLSQSIVFVRPKAVFDQLEMPIKNVKKKAGRPVRYNTAKLKLGASTWQQIDNFLHQLNYITESNEPDRWSHGINLTYQILTKAFQGQTSGTHQNGLRWRLLASVGKHKEEYLRNTKHNPVVRAAAAAALGHAFWEESEEILWKMAETAQSPYIAALVFTAMADAAPGRSSKYWYQIQNLIENPQAGLNWKTDPWANGLDHTRVRQAAAEVIKRLNPPSTNGQNGAAAPVSLGIAFLNPIIPLYKRTARRAESEFTAGLLAFLAGFLEDSLGRWAVITLLFPLLPLSLSPWQSIFLFASLFATVIHPKLFFGKDPQSLWFWQIPWKKQLAARTILFLLSVGIGAGGLYLPPLMPSFLDLSTHHPLLITYFLMGLLHALYNPIARWTNLFPLGLAGEFNGGDREENHSFARTMSRDLVKAMLSLHAQFENAYTSDLATANLGGIYAALIQQGYDPPLHLLEEQLETNSTPWRMGNGFKVLVDCNIALVERNKEPRSLAILKKILADNRVSVHAIVDLLRLSQALAEHRKEPIPPSYFQKLLEGHWEDSYYAEIFKRTLIEALAATDIHLIGQGKPPLYESLLHQAGTNTSAAFESMVKIDVDRINQGKEPAFQDRFKTLLGEKTNFEIWQSAVEALTTIDAVLIRNHRPAQLLPAVVKGLEKKDPPFVGETLVVLIKAACALNTVLAEEGQETRSLPLIENKMMELPLIYRRAVLTDLAKLNAALVRQGRDVSPRSKPLFVIPKGVSSEFVGVFIKAQTEIDSALVSRGRPREFLLYSPADIKQYADKSFKEGSAINHLPLLINAMSSIDRALIESGREPQFLTVWENVVRNCLADRMAGSKSRSHGYLFADLVSAIGRTESAFIERGASARPLSSLILVMEKTGEDWNIHTDVIDIMAQLCTASIARGLGFPAWSALAKHANPFQLTKPFIAFVQKGGFQKQDFERYELWMREIGTVEDSPVVDQYLHCDDPRIFIQHLKQDSENLIQNGFDYNDPENVFKAYIGTRLHGIDVRWREFVERMNYVKAFDDSHPGSFKRLFTKTKGMKTLQISSDSTRWLDTTQVNWDMLSRHVHDLERIKKEIDSLSWLDARFPKHKIFNLKNIYYQIKRQEAVDAERTSITGRFHIPFPNDEKMRAEIAADRKRLYKTLFKMALGRLTDKVAAPHCLELMRDLIVSDVMEDRAIVEALNSDDAEKKIYTIKMIYRDYANHLPGSIGAALQKIKADEASLAKLLDNLSRNALEEIAKATQMESKSKDTYTLVPAGFLGLFRGRAGIIDCSYDMDKGAQFTHAMHEDTLFYLVYKGRDPKGYVGLAWGEDRRKNRVLTIDTIQSAALDGEQLLMNLFKALHGFANEKEGMAIAIPENMRTPFNFDNRDTIAALPIYQDAEPVELKPEHTKSWKHFTLLFGEDPYGNNTIEIGEFLLLPPPNHPVPEDFSIEKGRRLARNILATLDLSSEDAGRILEKLNGGPSFTWKYKDWGIDEVTVLSGLNGLKGFIVGARSLGMLRNWCLAAHGFNQNLQGDFLPYVVFLMGGIPELKTLEKRLTRTARTMPKDKMLERMRRDLMILGVAQGLETGLCDITEKNEKPDGRLPPALMWFNPFAWVYSFIGNRNSHSKWLGPTAALGGFFEDSLGRWAVVTLLFPLLPLSLSPWQSIFLFASLFATVIHPKLFFGKDPKSLWFWQIPWKKQLIARTILFLLSVGIGAGGIFLSDFYFQFSILNFQIPINYLLMGLLHALYNPIARKLDLPLGMVTGFSEEDSIGSNGDTPPTTLDNILAVLGRQTTESFDLAHAFDGTGTQVAIVHVNSQEEMDNFESMLSEWNLSGKQAVIAVASENFVNQVEKFANQKNQVVVVPLEKLSKGKSGLYSYDEVLEQPNVKQLPAIEGRILAISREVVPFEASGELAERIDVILERANQWVRIIGGLSALLKAARAMGHDA